MLIKSHQLQLLFRFVLFFSRDFTAGELMQGIENLEISIKNLFDIVPARTGEYSRQTGNNPLVKEERKSLQSCICNLIVNI
jgi:hypothetical protein